MILCRDKYILTLGMGTLLFVLIGVPVTIGENTKTNSKQVTFESDSTKTQEISILVQPRAGETDAEVPENENSGGEQSEASSSADCDEGTECCFQYTWPGNAPVPTSSTNNTCEWLKSSKGKSIACFDPLVYTNTDGKKGPNITALIIGARERPDWKIYCKKADKSCVKYRFYQNTKARELVNETLFCGTVSETNSNGQISNGCFSEKVSGVIREVCVCNGNRCNRGTPEKLASLPFIVTIPVVTIIISHWVSRFGS